MTRPPVFTLQVVESRPGAGGETVIREFRFNSLHSCCAAADKMQRDYDADGEYNIRCYACGPDGIRLWAGGGTGSWPEESGRPSASPRPHRYPRRGRIT